MRIPTLIILGGLTWALYGQTGQNEVWVNGTFAIFDKSTGNLISGPFAGNTLWQGFGGLCESNNAGDPIAQYDKANDRWVMAQFTGDEDSTDSECFAISETDDATGAWYRYSFPMQSTFAQNSLSRWMGSMAMDSPGNKALGYGSSSSESYPSVSFTGGSPEIRRNTMESEVSRAAGSGDQIPSGRAAEWTGNGRVTLPFNSFALQAGFDSNFSSKMKVLPV